LSGPASRETSLHSLGRNHLAGDFPPLRYELDHEIFGGKKTEFEFVPEE
jgi:hypothetical protein